MLREYTRKGAHAKLSGPARIFEGTVEDLTSDGGHVKCDELEMDLIFSLSHGRMREEYGLSVGNRVKFAIGVSLSRLLACGVVKDDSEVWEKVKA